MAIGLAVGLFLVVLVLIIVQPRGLSIGWTALGGAIVAQCCQVKDAPPGIPMSSMINVHPPDQMAYRTTRYR